MGESGSEIHRSSKALDLLSVLKASEVLTSEIDLDRLIEKLVGLCLEVTGAERGALVLAEPTGPKVRAVGRLPLSVSLIAFPLEGCEDVPRAPIERALSTGEHVVLGDAARRGPFVSDPYIAAHGVQSALIMPIRLRERSVGAVYLENNLATRVFTADRVRVLGLLSSQMAIALENARLFEERKRAEERFSKAFHASPLPMAISRLRDGVILDVNETGLGVRGYKREEVVGRSSIELGILDSEQWERFHGVIRDKGAVSDFEVVSPAKNGQKRFFRFAAERIELEGEPCLLVISEDITERKLVEEQLRQSQKMEAIGRLAGGVAHDFNNLLTAINGYSSLMLDTMQATDRDFEFAREILKAGERAAGLTRQLLAYSRKQVLEPKLWELNEIVADMEPMLKRLIPADVKLSTVLRPDLGRVKVDRGQVEQVILNLVVNARDAMPHGGMLTLETGSVFLDETYLGTHLEASPGAHVMLTVSDTGTGIPPEIQARLFEPFFTTKGPEKGTGLGLSVVYGIVKQSGGSIAVYSDVNHGTTFRIYFPEVSEGGTPRAELTETEGGRSYRGSETLLIVDDDVSVRKFARHALEAQGYSILEAGSGREALTLVKGPTRGVNLIVTDIVMPDMGGFKLAKRLSKEHASIPILFVSGYPEPVELRGTMKPGDLFLQKPFSPYQLAKKVREALDAKSPRSRP